MVSEPTAQALGSAVTYAKRYALTALLGIAADEDDDGNAASGNTIEDSRDRKTNGARTATPRDQPKTDIPPAPTPRVPAAFWTQPSYAVKTFKNAGELAEKIGILVDEAPDTDALVKVDTDNASLIKNIADDGLRDRIRERIKNRHETLTLARNAAA